MAINASNIVFAAPSAPPEPKQKSIVVGGGNWRDKIAQQILDKSDTQQPSLEIVENVEEIKVAVKSKKSRKKSEKLIEYKDSPFLNDMLSINKE